MPCIHSILPAIFLVDTKFFQFLNREKHLRIRKVVIFWAELFVGSFSLLTNVLLTSYMVPIISNVTNTVIIAL
jgi:hypothetical protein